MTLSINDTNQMEWYDFQQHYQKLVESGDADEAVSRAWYRLEYAKEQLYYYKRSGDPWPVLIATLTSEIEELEIMSHSNKTEGA